MMFRMATGEDWHAVMYDTMKHNKLNVIYFLLFVITFQYIMVNLFVLVILREFDEHYNNFDNPFVYYNDYFHVFKIYWNKYAQQSQGIKVSQKDAAQIYLEMEKPLGLGIFVTLCQVSRNRRQSKASFRKKKMKKVSQCLSKETSWRQMKNTRRDSIITAFYATRSFYLSKYMSMNLNMFTSMSFSSKYTKTPSSPDSLVISVFPTKEFLKSVNKKPISSQPAKTTKYLYHKWLKRFTSVPRIIKQSRINWLGSLLFKIPRL